ncbi:phage holin family protein [Nocardioides sp.]|uniref:phage holin family protein n=1 Tax=Nocardioides sp. TaxID=35761 RepID=UPI002B2680F8|nr:phage holin family protein [Nocardioides sp.]
MSDRKEASRHAAPESVHPTHTSEAGVGELMATVAQDLSTLVRDEMALAKTEITESVTKAGLGAGLFGTAGLVALYGVGALVATLVLVLALVVPAWLAALIVTLGLFAVAGIAALLGKKELDQATPPLEHSKESVRRDVDALKGGAS